MIRPAQPDDAADIAALLNHWIMHSAITFSSTLKTVADIETSIADKAAAGHGFFVATENGTLVGQASYGQFRAGAGYATCLENSVTLLPGARGKGTGRALMKALEDHARSRGGHQMVACVSGENPEGRDFHARLGYALIACLPQAGFKFGRFMDLWLMQKFL